MKKTSREICLSDADRHRKYYQETYLSPAYKRQIFETHDIEFALKKGPAFEQSRDYNTALYVGHALSLNGKRGIYGAGSISKGMLANSFVVKEGPFPIEHDDGTIVWASHVYDMDETVGSQNFVDKVLEHNKRVQIQKHALFRMVFPGRAILIPASLQGALGVAGQPEFDRGAKRRDKNFMQLWTPDIREHTDIFPVIGDWNFSGATSGLEYVEALCIAAGLRDPRPEADLWFRDLNNRDVPLSDMLLGYANYQIWAAEQGDFYLKHEATAFMRGCAIAEMARRGMLPRGNRVFLEGIEKNFDDIDYLRKQMEPLILDRIKTRMVRMDVADLEAVNPDFVAKALAAREESRSKPQRSYTKTSGIPDLRENLAKRNLKIDSFSAEQLEAGDFEFREIDKKFDRDSYLDATDKLVVTLPMRPVNMRGDAHVGHDGRSLFSRPLLQGFNERERHQIGTMVGGLETSMPRDGRVLYVVADDRFGAETEKTRQARGLRYGDEVRAELGAFFDATIRPAQRRHAQELPLLQRFRNQGQPVHFSHDMEDQAATFGALKKFSMSEGEAMPGEDAALLARHTVLARGVTDFCFVTGQWEESKNGVQDMMLATRMQMGLEAASPIDPLTVRVFDEKGRYLTLADRLQAVWERLEPALRQNHDLQNLQEQVSAVAQLWALHRLARDHAMRRHVFNDLRERDPNIELPQDLRWERIMPFLFAYDHVAFDAYWYEKVRPVLEGPAATAVRLRHLDAIEDFATIRQRQIASQEIAAAARTNASIYRRGRYAVGGGLDPI